MTSTPATTTPTTKHSGVSPPGELDETSADLMRPLPTIRRTFSELQMPVQSAEYGEGTKVTDSSAVIQKVRYFSNFYRQPEPGEVFVGSRLKVETGREVCSDRSTKYESWMTDNRPYLLPLHSPSPLNFMTKPHSMTAAQDQRPSLFDPSLAAVWSGYPVVHRTMTSFPPSLDHVTACDFIGSSSCRRS